MLPTTGAVASALLAQSDNQLFVTTPAWWPSALPAPELTAAILVGMLVLAGVSTVLTVRVVVPLGIKLGQEVRRTWNRITPKSTFGKVMTIFAVLLVVVMAPTLVTLVDAKGALGGVASNPDAIAEMDGDTFEFEGEPITQRPEPDRDGDRLLDDWERAGETPAGVPLPGADPDRKDIYLQIIYAEGVEPLSETERDSLERIWAKMPVANPDGSQGISLHIVDERRLNRKVTSYEPSKKQVRSRYNANHLGDATCVYYQTTFGEITHPNLGGRGALGGYVSLVDGIETTTQDGRTHRVSFLTHELLHNTAGPVDGRPHTKSGWLAATYNGSNANLSSPTAAQLERGFAIGSYEEQHVCGR